MLCVQDHILANDHDGPVLCVATSPDGSAFAAGDGHGTVKLWNLASEELRVVLRGHGRAVWSLTFAADGRLLASAGHDGTIKLWDALSGEERVTLRPEEQQLWSVRSVRTATCWPWEERPVW